MKTVWLVLASPYDYDPAMWRSRDLAQALSAQLRVVFFIEKNAASNIMQELGEMEWLGPSSLRSLQNCMLEGYRALADDVLDRVRRKVTQVEVVLEGVVEEVSLADYVTRLLPKEETQTIVVSGSKPLDLEVSEGIEKIEWFEG